MNSTPVAHVVPVGVMACVPPAPEITTRTYCAGVPSRFLYVTVNWNDVEVVPLPGAIAPPQTCVRQPGFSAAHEAATVGAGDNPTVTATASSSAERPLRTVRFT